MARRQLEPEGALTGATRELQAGLGAFLQVCHEHGVKVGPWRLQHVVGEWTFGEHPTYGVLTIAHWACKDGQPWKVGIGLFLGSRRRQAERPRNQVAALEAQPAMIDHLILLAARRRPGAVRQEQDAVAGCGTSRPACPAGAGRHWMTSRYCTLSRAGWRR